MQINNLNDQEIRLEILRLVKETGSNELHIGRGGESLADTAKILSTYGDGSVSYTHLTLPTILLV